MAYKGSTVVSVEKFLAIAALVSASVEHTSGYIIITKPGAPDKQVLVEKSLKKGATVATARWVELRGKGKTPYVVSSPGIVPHVHSSPSITHRLDTDADEATILKNFSLLINLLCDVKPAQTELTLTAPAEEAAAQAA
jgi:hypothetical protein